MKKFFKRKIMISIVVFMMLAAGSLFFWNNAKANIYVIQDGIPFGSSITYQIDRFPGGYQYSYRENWNVIVNGVNQGQMILMVPPEEESSKGRTFAHADTLYAWGAAMGGNPTYVRDTLKDYGATKIVRISDKQPYYRYYSRDIAEESGAFLTVKDSGGGNGYLDIKTTPFPSGALNAPTEVEAGQSFSVIFDAKEYEPFKSDKIEWSIFVNSSLKQSGTESLNVINDKTIPITINGEGEYTIKLVVTDAIQRSTTYEKTVTSKAVVTGPIETPDNPDIPEPEPNDPPVARIDSNSTVKAGDYLDVTGINSTDGDGYITVYSWGTGSTLYSSLSGNTPSGKVVYPSEGLQSIYLTVTDDDAATDTTARTITVLPPTPEAVLQFGDGSVQKVNRKVILDANNTKSPAFYPVKWPEAVWEIVPLEGQSSANIKVNGSLTGGSTKEMLFKQVGKYQAKVTVINEAGFTDEQTLLIDIQPDVKPDANFSLVNKTFRDTNVVGENNEILAKVNLTNLSKSTDDDIIKKVVYKAIYDANNDGNYSEAPIVIDSDSIVKNQTVSFPTKNNKKVYVQMDNSFNLSFYAPDVGGWKFELEAKEDFGQPTIPAFIVDADYLRNNTDAKVLTEKILLIDNQAPTVQWGS